MIMNGLWRYHAIKSSQNRNPSRNRRARAVADAALTPVRRRPMVVATAFQHTMY
jgi:hypothetical protein